VEYIVPTINQAVHDINTGQITRQISLSNDIFGQLIRSDIIQRVVIWQQAKARQGGASTKTRAQVSGTGAKPHPQKGGGRARMGTKRAPHHRGGGVAHGKKLRDFSFPLNKKLRRLGVKMALSAKYQEKNLFLIEDPNISSPKTKHLKELLEKLNIKEFLLVHANQELGNNMILAARNLQHHDFLPAAGINVLSILRHPTLILTVKAVEQISAAMAAAATRRGPRFLVGSSGGGMNYLQYLQWKKQQKSNNQQYNNNIPINNSTQESSQ
jgi:large subunit ribosomal protein L4